MVAVGVAEGVIVSVGVGLSLTIPVDVGVADGDAQKVETDSGAAPPPLVSSSRVPNRPLVLTWVDCAAVSSKELVAMGVPLSSRV